METVSPKLYNWKLEHSVTYFIMNNDIQNQMSTQQKVDLKVGAQISFLTEL